MIPDTLRADVDSSAERLLFDEFRRQLPDTFHVLHGVAWLQRDRRRYDRDGEIDFLIIHPHLGLLVLEVKGGRIAVDGATGVWSSMDRHGQAHRLSRSPFDQARDNLFALKAKLEAAPGTRATQFRYQRGVVFPNVLVGSGDLGLAGEREIIIDSSDLNDLERAVLRVMGQGPTPQSGPPAIDERTLAALIDTLAPTREITRVGLQSQMLQTEREMLRLTESQFGLLTLLQRHHRAVITGCAGSGKTLLAMEKARRLVADGERVLFTCFNRNLAVWLRAQFAADTRIPAGQIHVATFHELAEEFARRAGTPMHPPAGPGEAISRYYAEELPIALQEALATVDTRFDALIVDEGQDFAELWWVALLDLLAAPDNGVLYIFCDDHQRIYQDALSLPISDNPYTLTVNCRNAAPIHDVVVRYHHGDPPPTSSDLVGLQPEVIPLPTDRARGEREERDALGRAFAQLFQQEGLQPSDVVILTPRNQASSRLPQGTRIGNRVLTWSDTPGPGEVRITTIHAFKGLESPVIILAEGDRVPEYDSHDALLYVGLSRARQHLVILGELPDARGSTST